ncbi:methyltransferase domain-containing protein [Paenibacillus vini]|uniref:class I SAM-dependent methyltransferase n=1 Tax=Paenibacillus vini TaxID=1476024 RepID=UPI0025B67BA0|nr:methyltransferase domain-containing protein [Paenibacillus vini]MDN4066454.1 methyltransferase domain-containing protein [Paenibacillus vini]
MNKLHFGPGPNWIKPSSEWLTVDIDKERGDIQIDFNKFDHLPIEDTSIYSIYGSHVFEHMSIFAAPKVFKECYRVLVPGGYLRIVLPDVKKSLEEYLKGNYEYPLFQRRMQFLKERNNFTEVTLFEALKGDFLSPTGQTSLLGNEGLAHQNAWDLESIIIELTRVGFQRSKIKQMEWKKTDCSDFSFEGSYPSEANEEYRSLYIEATK